MDSATNAALDAPPRFSGTRVQLGDTQYVIPPLALGKVKELLPRVQELGSLEGVPTAEQMATIGDLVLAALQRNYPTMTTAQLDELIDLGNMKQILSAVLGQSGLVPMTEGNGVPGTAAPSTGG